MEQVTSEPLGEPRGEPVAYYFRDLLLIGGGATRLYLVRHAQSEGNRGEYEGPDDDPPLSTVGHEQAGRLARRFARQSVDAVYSSPLRRALETAQAIEECPGKRVVIVCHGAVIQTYVSHVLGLERDFAFYAFNAGITSIRAEGERRVIWRLNDVAHLDGLPPGFGGIS